MSNIADDVKCRLRRIAHSINQTQIDEAVASLKEWDMFKGKLKTWFEGMNLLEYLSTKNERV